VLLEVLQCIAPSLLAGRPRPAGGDTAAASTHQGGLRHMPADTTHGGCRLTYMKLTQYLQHACWYCRGPGPHQRHPRRDHSMLCR
jgi:hypothetical protein